MEPGNDGFPSSESPWKLGGEKKLLGQKAKGAVVHADEDQTKVTSTVNSIYKNHPIHFCWLTRIF